MQSGSFVVAQHKRSDGAGIEERPFVHPHIAAQQLLGSANQYGAAACSDENRTRGLAFDELLKVAAAVQAFPIAVGGESNTEPAA